MCGLTAGIRLLFISVGTNELKPGNAVEMMMVTDTKFVVSVPLSFSVCYY